MSNSDPAANRRQIVALTATKEKLLKDLEQELSDYQEKFKIERQAGEQIIISRMMEIVSYAESVL